jgi:predicted RND superfamily exporter protein
MRLTVSNPGGAWDPNPPPDATAFWNATREHFGEADVLLIGIGLPDTIPATYRATEAFERWLRGQAEVQSVLGPLGADEMSRGFLRRWALGRDRLALERAVMEPDSGMVLMFTSLHPPPIAGSLDLPTAILARIHAEGVDLLPPGAAVMIGGKPAADVALNQLLNEDARRSAPRALGVMLVVLFVFFGWGAFGPCIGVALAAVLVLGGLAVSGQPLSTATIVTLPITVIVGLAYGIHMEAAVHRVGPTAGRRELRAPLGWAFATTAAAIGGFALSSVPAFRAFALTAGGGVGAAYLAALFLVPYLWSGRGRGPVLRQILRAGVRISFGALRHPRTMGAAWLLGAVVLLSFLPDLRLEPNNYLGFFPDDHPVLTAHRRLDRIFGGSLPLYAVASVDPTDSVARGEVGARLRTFLERAQGLVPLGPSLPPLQLDAQSEPLLRTWFHRGDGRLSRAILSMPLLPTAEARSALAVLDSLALDLTTPELRLRVTGPLPAGLPILDHIVRSQLITLGLALLIILAALTTAGRHRNASLMLLPNLLPVLSVAATMGWCGIPLDFTTAVVLSMVLGVSVDDTIQIMWAIGTPSGRASPAFGVRRVVIPVTVTTMAAVAGFVTLCFSAFPVTRHLGGLMAVGLTVAWLADLTLTPLILAASKSKTEASTASRRPPRRDGTSHISDR